MTAQYGKKNINESPTGARNVDQTNIDGNLTTPAVVLTNDDGFVIVGDDGASGAYRANLPDVRETSGREITLKVGAVAVTLGTVEIDGVASGQTIEGGATLVTAAGDSVILRADPPTTFADPDIPAVPSNNWSTIKVGAP